MKIFLFLTTIVVFLPSINFSQNCEWCERRVILTEVKNDIVEGSDKMHASSIYGITYEALLSNWQHCFSWIMTSRDLQQFEGMPEKEIMDFNLKHGKPPEYIFKALFESGLEGVKKPSPRILTTDTVDFVEAKSRFTMELYYNGETEEFVDKWVTLGTMNRVSPHYQAMCRNNKAEMKKKNPVDVMYEFEQIPTDCSVNPDRDIIAINDSMEIEISDFEGYYGGKPKPFNRIIVHALYGRITNGTECDIGPDYKVFTLENESVTVNYRSPTECEKTEDRITVFNSCDILPESKWPLKKTEMKDRIIEKNINISCWDATLVVKKKVIREEVKDKSEDSFNGNCKSHNEEHYKLNETIDASVLVALELEYSVDMPIFNQTYEYYKPIDENISYFNYTSSDSKILNGNHSGSGCAKVGDKTTVQKQRTLNNSEIQGKGTITETRWIVAIDNETQKAVKIIPAGYDLDYQITEKESMHSVVWSDDGTNEDSKTDSKTSDKTFSLGPVEDPIPDPTVKNNNRWVQDYLKRQGINLPEGVQIPDQEDSEVQEEIPPDILVTFGDGETNFGGEGSKTLNKPNEYGYENEEQTYFWQMTRKKKNK